MGIKFKQNHFVENKSSKFSNINNILNSYQISPRKGTNQLTPANKRFLTSLGLKIIKRKE